MIDYSTSVVHSHKTDLSPRKCDEVTDQRGEYKTSKGFRLQGGGRSGVNKGKRYTLTKSYTLSDKGRMTQKGWEIDIQMILTLGRRGRDGARGERPKER